MSKTTKSGRFNVGDWVEFPYGTRKLIAQVVEARGPLGVNRRHLYRVAAAEKPGQGDSFEMPEDELTLTETRPSWFLDEKAFQFVSEVWMKHSDVVVRPYAGHDMAIDLLVEILKKGRSTLRFFGAQLVADLKLPPIREAGAMVLSHLGRDSFEADLPLCAFVVGVGKPEAIYRWVVEPVIEDGHAVLCRDTIPLHQVEASWTALDEKGADRLITQANAWYDARNRNWAQKN